MEGGGKGQRVRLRVGFLYSGRWCGLLGAVKVANVPERRRVDVELVGRKRGVNVPRLQQPPVN